MKRLAGYAACSFLLVCLTTPNAAAQGEATKAAQTAATAWLALVDSGKYAESWDQAAALFKGAISKEDWVRAVTGVRKPLGALVSRKLKAAKYTKTLPGAPDGEYVVIQFETSFKNKKKAIETLTPMMDKDKKWRVSGYFIK